MMNLTTQAAPGLYTNSAYSESKYDSVILIDDNRMDLMLNKSLLKKNNYARNLLAFINPRNALVFLAQAYSNKVFDTSEKQSVIFLDLYMPEMSGFDFLEAFDKFDTAFRKKFRIYLLSNCTNPMELQKARHCRSLHGFLPKPLSSRIASI